MKKAIFLDRDGTLIKETFYLHNPDKIEIIPNTLTALKQLQQKGFLLIMITNQSGIGQKMYRVSDFLAVQTRLLDTFTKENIHFTNFYYCPHHPTKGKGRYKKNCECRKPKPGLILKAAKTYDIDLKNSFIIGDKLDDILAGQNAGLKTILVKTGYGKKTAETLKEIKPNFIALNLSDAVNNYIIEG